MGVVVPDSFVTTQTPSSGRKFVGSVVFYAIALLEATIVYWCVGLFAAMS